MADSEVILGVFENGSVFKDSAAGVFVLDGNAWVKPPFPVTGGMIMDSRPLRGAEIAALKLRGIELK